MARFAFGMDHFAAELVVLRGVPARCAGSSVPSMAGTKFGVSQLDGIAMDGYGSGDIKHICGNYGVSDDGCLILRTLV